MAPAVSSGAAKRKPPPAPVVDQTGQLAEKPPVPQPASAGAVAAAAAGRMPDHVRAMLQRLRAEVEKSCENVGDGFADEARRIHNGESEARGIYGNATPEQAEALAEDGIEVARVPWIPRADG